MINLVFECQESWHRMKAEPTEATPKEKAALLKKINGNLEYGEMRLFGLNREDPNDKGEILTIDLAMKQLHALRREILADLKSVFKEKMERKGAPKKTKAVTEKAKAGPTKVKTGAKATHRMFTRSLKSKDFKSLPAGFRI